MRTLKILSLLFSLGQFLLILKIIELVRGDPIQNEGLVSLREKINQKLYPETAGRSFYLAPSKAKQKKYRLWGTTTTEEMSTTDNNFRRIYDDYQFDENENATDLTIFNVSRISTSESPETGRLCPGCEGGNCGGVATAYGFPVIPVAIAVIVGIVWFFIFLFLWFYASEPPKSGYDQDQSSSYGYGQSGYTSSYRSLGNSILDLIGGDQLNNFNQLTSIITDSLSMLSHLYAS